MWFFSIRSLFKSHYTVNNLPREVWNVIFIFFVRDIGVWLYRQLPRYVFLLSPVQFSVDCFELAKTTT